MSGKTSQRPLLRIARIEQVAAWISKGLTPRQIHIAGRREWSVCKATMWRYIQKAREWMLRDLESPLALVRASALRQYDLIISDPKTTTRDRLVAIRDKLALLRCLDSHVVHEHRGGLDIHGQITVETVREFVVSLQKDRDLRQRIHGLNGSLKTLTGGSAVDLGGISFDLPGQNGSGGHDGALPDGKAPDAPR
jgi:hypothetical protein